MLVRFISSLIRDSKAAKRQAASADGLPQSLLQQYRGASPALALQAAAERLAQDPHDVEAQLVHSLGKLDAGQPAEALRLLQAALAQAPNDAQLVTASGRAHMALGRRAAADQAFERALALAPDSAEPRLHMARMALQAGQYAKVAQLLTGVVEREPDLVDAQLLLGNARLALGDAAAAERHYRQALAADDQLADAHANLGALLKDGGDADGAALHLERALELSPGHAQASFNLALLRITDNQWDGVVALLRGSLQQDAKQADAWYWLGNALMREGAAAAAREAYGSAVSLDRQFVRARWGLVMAQLPAVPASVEEQRAAAPNFAREFKKLQAWIGMHRGTDTHQAVGAQQPYYLAYLAQDHRAVLRDYGVLCSQLMAGWGGAGLAAPAVGRGAKRKVGIVSAHICSHSVWHALVRGWVEHLDRGTFELHLWHTGHMVDAQTQWASRQAQLHRQPGDWTAWAQAIAAKRFDVLVYPEIGMDATTLRLAALRLAPVQLAAWGHPITTGLPTVDGFVSAQAFEPAGAERHYSERLHALPGLGCCYQPYDTRAQAVDLGAWGIQPGERVLLCAGTPFKYAPDNDALLVEIARRCAPCKLVFFRSDPPALAQLLEKRLRQAFQAAGADFDASVRFIPWQSQAAFFGLLDQAHLLLDSAGFSGFNTAMQAVERGLPVVAWEGDFMRGRFASGILRSMGQDALVAGSAPDYLAKVEQLCAQPAQRAQAHAQLAERRAALFNDRAAVAAFGSLLAQLS